MPAEEEILLDVVKPVHARKAGPADLADDGLLRAGAVGAAVDGVRAHLERDLAARGLFEDHVNLLKQRPALDGAVRPVAEADPASLLGDLNLYDLAVVVTVDERARLVVEMVVGVRDWRLRHGVEQQSIGILGHKPFGLVGTI